MLTAIGVLLSLTFIGFLIYWGFRRKPIRAHVLMYLLATMAGIFTLTFFFTMDIARIVKVLVSIFVGAILIFIAAYTQGKKKPETDNRPEKQ